MSGFTLPAPTINWSWRGSGCEGSALLYSRPPYLESGLGYERMRGVTGSGGLTGLLGRYRNEAKILLRDEKSAP